MTMTSEPTPEGDLDLLTREFQREELERMAAEISERSIFIQEYARTIQAAAVSRLVNLMDGKLSRITIPITQHYDWDRLRINVAHRVEPTLVKWGKP
jgi:hypothetical protein